MKFRTVLAAAFAVALSFCAVGSAAVAQGVTTESVVLPVRVATTANITLSGTQTIDGVSVVAGDRVLVKNQSTASQNGVYVVAAGAWARAVDFNKPGQVVQGTAIYVNAGTTQAGFIFAVSASNPVVPGSSSISFAQAPSGVPGALANPTGQVGLNAVNGTAATGIRSDGAPAVAAEISTPLTSYRGPVRVATTANITLSGAQTIDGVSVVSGDRVLVKNQTIATQNGIYVAANSSWARSADFNAAGQVVQGTAIYVNSGGQTGHIYTITNSGTITPGTTSIVFARTQPSGATVSAGLFGAAESSADNATAINNCLVAVGQTGTCSLAGLGRLTVLNNILISGGRTLDCGYNGVPARDNGSTNYNTIPAILLDSGATIYGDHLAVGAGWTLQGCAILQRGLSWPQTGTTGWAGTAIQSYANPLISSNSNGYVRNVLVLGFNTCLWSWGARDMAENLYCDSSGEGTLAAIELATGNTDIANATNIRVETFGAGLGCAALARPGTAIRVSPSATFGVAGLGTWINDALVFGWDTGIDFTSEATIGRLWLDHPPCGSTVSKGITSTKGFTVTDLFIGQFYDGMLIKNGGQIASIKYAQINAIDRDAVQLGDLASTTGAILDIGTATLNGVGRYAFNVLYYNVVLTSRRLELFSVNGTAAPYIVQTLGNTVIRQNSDATTAPSLWIDSLWTDLAANVSPYSGFTWGAYDLYAADDGATVNPIVRLRRYSATPAVNDRLGDLQYYGRNSAATPINYGGVKGSIIDPTGGGTGGWIGYASFAGSTVDVIKLQSNGLVIYPTQYIRFPGSSSGEALLHAQAAAGTPTLSLPTSTGTLVSTAASPLSVNSTTGQVSCSSCLTTSGGALTGPITISYAGLGLDVTNTTNAASNQVAKWSSANATRANADNIYHSFLLANSAGTQKEIARLVTRIENVTAGAESGVAYLYLANSGTLAERFVWTPVTFAPAANDAATLGTSLFSWSDLFLASGGVINWNNGTYTLTQSASTLTANGDIALVGVQTTPATVSGLPTCNGGLAGMRRHVTDATATLFASIAAGGGGNIVPVMCNGTNWIIGSLPANDNYGVSNVAAA